MAQYWQYNEGKYNYRTDTNTGLRVRFGQRSGAFVTDVELTITGFGGIEDIDWTNLSSSTQPVHSGKYREGVRSAAYVLDGEISSPGFLGTENVNWEQLI